MVTKIRKSAKLFTASVLTLGLLAGCGGNTTSKTEEPSQKPAASTKDNDLTPVTFSLFASDANPNWNKMQDDVGKEITKLTGVTLDAEFAVGDSAQKVALIATSGEYPDLISPKGELNKLVDAGAMIDLTDLIDQYAPNIKKMLGDQIKRLRYSNEDKSIYVIPTYAAVDNVNFVAAGGFSLQHRAVKEAGYPTVKTLQDYENVIKSYLDKHPTDENGNPNIGLTLNADDWHTYISVTNPAAESTGKAGDGEWYIDPNTYEATYHYRTEGEKDYFKWLNHMYNTGLLDKDTFVQKSDQYNAKVASGRVIGLIDADWSFGDGLKALKKDGKFDQTYGYFPVMLSDKYKDNRLQSTGEALGRRLELVNTGRRRSLDPAKQDEGHYLEVDPPSHYGQTGPIQQDLGRLSTGTGQCRCEKMEKDFTKYVQDRVKLWNE